MLASLRTAGVIGIEATAIHVEVDVSSGLPGFTMVGLPDASVRESRDRVRTAIRNAGFRLPAHRITVNLAPADMRKVGASFDLPIALGILAATGVLEHRELSNTLVLGALSLDGAVQPVSGVLAIAVAATRLGVSTIVLPAQNAPEAAVVAGLRIAPVTSLREAVDAWNHPESIQALVGGAPCVPPAPSHDLSDVRGQQLAKRGLEIAAAGGHHLLLVGPPGAGKTMLARRLATLLPEPSYEEALEITAIHSVAGHLPVGAGLLAERPFRAPHHTISHVALVGGGVTPRPGEACLAHRGVLFLDEVLEFRRAALDALRQPLEEGQITISRAARLAVFPARFQLVGATNPCPCGYLGNATRVCHCTPLQVVQYQARLSGPLRDRIDLSVDVQAVPHDALLYDETDARVERSAVVRQRVGEARLRQARRARSMPADLNGQLAGPTLALTCTLDRTCTKLLHSAAQRLGLSARAFDSVRRVARTIADLKCRDEIADEDIAEALQFRADALMASSRDLRTRAF